MAKGRRKRARLRGSVRRGDHGGCAFCILLAAVRGFGTMPLYVALGAGALVGLAGAWIGARRERNWRRANPFKPWSASPLRAACVVTRNTHCLRLGEELPVAFFGPSGRIGARCGHSALSCLTVSIHQFGEGNVRSAQDAVRVWLSQRAMTRSRMAALAEVGGRAHFIRASDCMIRRSFIIDIGDRLECCFRQTPCWTSAESRQRVGGAINAQRR